MKQTRQFLLFVLVTALAIVSLACAEQQGRVDDAQKAVAVPQKSNFFERKQVAEAEILNDKPGKVYWWYVLAGDGRLITQFTCIGRPASSTESLEPNQIWSTSAMGYGFKVPLEEGQEAFSTEAMGVDGTYGEPVPFRYCITPEGHYVDVSHFTSSIVSSIPLTFAAPQVKFDEQLEAKKLVAEKTIKDGGCIDSNLNPINCAEVKKNKGEQ